ncbi:MAG: hypothetical protein ACRDT4_05190 [Micromonosporaceae bacterium]
MTTATLTPTCQTPSEVTTAAILRVLEDAWGQIRTRHPDVPEAVLIIGPGTAGKGRPKWGHFAALRWQHGSTQLPEILIAGEGLARSAEEVLATLLHEAAHGVASVRRIQDTSRQGRWHNKRFAALADELGLTAEKDPTIGWSLTTIREATKDTYADTLTALTGAMRLYRHPDPERSTSRKDSNNGLTCECDCPRKIRVAAAVLEEGEITCGVCGTDFTPESG